MSEELPGVPLSCRIGTSSEIGGVGRVRFSRPGLTVEHLGNIDIARDRLTRFVGTRPDGLLILDKKLRVTEVDSGAIFVLGLEIGDVLGEKVYDCFPRSLKSEISEVLVPAGETRVLTLSNQGAITVMAIEVDAGLALGIWKLSDRAEGGLPVQELDLVRAFREFASVRTLPEIVATLGRVGLAIDPTSAGSLLLPVQGALITVGSWPSSGEVLTQPIVSFDDLPDSSTILAGEEWGVLNGSAELDLSISRVYSGGNLSCVLVTTLDSEAADELLKWVTACISRI